jgi:HD-GYP domain-containing protein (c-di-GMP phosphodiesterase class II)
MKLVPIQQVAGKLKAGEPLPFGVRDAEGKLLLAKGQMVPNEDMREALLNRGVFVDLDELKPAANSYESTSAGGEDFFGRWEAMQTRLAVLLRAPDETLFLPRVKECASQILQWAERYPDQLIFVVMRHDHSRHEIYGLVHLLHCAAVVAVLVRRLEWPVERQRLAVGAALTMNLPIIDLQGRLASRGGKLAPQYRALIDAHPTESVALLRAAGLKEQEWLDAVAQHHEETGGVGYPNKVQEPTEMAQLLHLVDVFLAKHASRGGRPGLPAPQAARDIYTGSKGHPIAGLIVKEFGLFPPGTLVKLACGEIAVSVRPGTSGNAPLVGSVTNRQGDPLAKPVRRDTTLADFNIVGLASAQHLRVKLMPHQLYDLRF